jgi:hypothetical protein
VGKGALKNQDYRRLGKIRTIAKDLRISHPTFASMRNHFASDTREQISNAGAIWTTKN